MGHSPEGMRHTPLLPAQVKLTLSLTCSDAPGARSVDPQRRAACAGGRRGGTPPGKLPAAQCCQLTQAVPLG